MGEFFDSRLDGCGEHMMNNIESAGEFYPFTAECLPMRNGCDIIDLGCGTGLELEYYFKYVENANVTGIDIAQGMLNALKLKFPDKQLRLVLGSYFDVPFGDARYDAAVSVESSHHFYERRKNSII